MSRFSWKALSACALGVILLHSSVSPVLAVNYVLLPNEQSRFAGDPRLLNSQAYTNPIYFDTEWDPTGGIGTLPQEAKDILISHRIAQQQVELAIQFLEANRAAILSGAEPKFISVFGDISRQYPAARLESSQTRLGQGSISGGAQGGQGSFTITDSGGSGTSTSFWKNQLRAGDWIAIDTGGSSSGFRSDAIVRQIQRIERDSDGGHTIYLDQTGQPIPSGTSLQNATISRVLDNRDTRRTLPNLLQRQADVLDQVIDTFSAIRTALNGVDPDDSTQFQNEIVYNKQYTRFTDVWGRGVGEFDQGITRDQSPSSVPAWFTGTEWGETDPAYIPDRRLRQAGFSTSNSADHIDVIEAERFGVPTRYDAQNSTRTGHPLSDRGLAARPDPTANRAGVIDALPLLWTEDNDDPTRSYFESQQMIFAGPNLRDSSNTVFDIYTGPRFYSGAGFETVANGGRFDGLSDIAYAADLFDDWRNFAANNMTSVTRLITDPYATDRLSDALRVTTSSGSSSSSVIQYASVLEAGSGTAIERTSALRQWQFIVQTFAEWSTDFSHDSLNNVPDVAVVGLMDMLTNRNNVFQSQVTPLRGRDLSLQARDAGLYARFAALINTSTGGNGTAPSEPVGKRASAGFYPVVFRR